MAKTDGASLNISLPQQLKHFVEEQTTSGGYTSASEYVRELIRAARRKKDQLTRVELMLLEGLNSGGAMNVDDAYWDAKAQQLTGP